MQPAAPVLTPERIDAMLSVVAETCLAGVTAAGERLQSAEDMADFERAGRTLASTARIVRQVIMLKQRYDRERAAQAADARRAAAAEREDAEREHGQAVWSHRTRVRQHFERVLWDEYEDDDAQEVFEDLEDRLGDLAGDAGFLETPVETLIARLTEEFGVGAAVDEADAPPATMPETGREDADDAEAKANTDDADWGDPPLEVSEPAGPSPPLAADTTEPTQVQAPPPDPPPEPYIPPWERNPHAVYPGGSGW